MNEQPEDYRFIYIMHFVSGGALLVLGLLDAVQIPGWTLMRRHGQLTTLYSPYPLAPAYALVVAVATLAVTLTWTAVVEWDTSDLRSLLATMLLVIVVVGALSAASLSLLFPRIIEPRRVGVEGAAGALTGA